MLTMGIGAGVSGIGSLLGGIFGGGASAKAAEQLAAAEQKGVNTLQASEDKGLANYSPYLSAGAGATGTLSQLLGTPGQGLLTPWTQQFQAPTAAQAEQTPGYQFQLQQGENALQNSAAGRGSLLSGRTLADLNNYAQGTASSNYQNQFNNALTQYQSAYNTFLNNQNSQYSKLMGMSQQGLGAAGGAGNLISGIGSDIASLYGAQGAARAQGTIGQANAYGSILPGLGNTLSQFGLLSQLRGGGGAAPPPISAPSVDIGAPLGTANLFAPSMPGIPS
jgi:hypothetical protein